MAETIASFVVGALLLALFGTAIIEMIKYSKKLINDDGKRDEFLSESDSDRVNKLRKDYLEAYTWVVRTFKTDKNAIRSVGSDIASEKFNYKMCYDVCWFPSLYLPDHFPKLKSEVSNPSGYETEGEEEFMEEFLGIVKSLKDDSPLINLCDKYGVDVDFGIVGKHRRLKKHLSDWGSF